MSITIHDITEFVDFLMCHPKQALFLIFSLGFCVYFIISSYIYIIEEVIDEDYFEKKNKKETDILDDEK